jgi:protein-tyrosine kinase
MSRLLATLRKMHHTGKWTPTLGLEVPDTVLHEPVLPKRNHEAIDRVLAKLALPDSGSEGLERAQAKREKSHTEPLKTIEGDTYIDERVMAFPQFASGAAEQYRKLYIEIVQARRLRELQTLLITSAVAGEGKSLSALNLAITCATTGDQHGVLLIDTDLRRPSIHNYLSIHPKYGLADYLLGDVEYSQICFQTQIPGLTVISAGRMVSNPTALLASKRIGQLIREVKSQQQYSDIILDSSPVLLTSESKSLLQYVDTTILIVRAKKTPTEVVLQAIKMLGEENILGCVLNGVTASDFFYYDYYHNTNYYCADNDPS